MVSHVARTIAAGAEESKGLITGAMAVFDFASNPIVKIGIGALLLPVLYYRGVSKLSENKFEVVTLRWTLPEDAHLETEIDKFRPSAENLRWTLPEDAEFEDEIENFRPSTKTIQYIKEQGLERILE